MTAALLQYSTTQGILIERIDMHSLQSSGANALALLGYLDAIIRKMGCWKGATFKEYILKELACYSTGMSMNMNPTFKFVNVSGNAYHNVTTTCFENEYNINCVGAA